MDCVDLRTLAACFDLPENIAMLSICPTSPILIMNHVGGLNLPMSQVIYHLFLSLRPDHLLYDTIEEGTGRQRPDPFRSTSHALTPEPDSGTE
jgi:hypothetical protein